ncbi:hypothetical protein EDC94DRAFT_132530 [Helicostylum pulchrum]|nr:hypothetical protein EDC94DRAFT_132530 [Helicostylum pulchrum]
MLKNRFFVYLINEFLTSSLCPLYEASLQTFKTVPNPRPHKRTSMPTVTCHRSLRCNDNQCFESDNSEKMRLWNRDLAAVLNFRKILFSLRNTGKRPSVFDRN